MFDPKLAIGQVLSENEVNTIFQCQPFKGIRMGMNNKVIVVISGSAKRKIYDDVWDGDTLLYNGMDVSSDGKGNQTLETAGANNNSKLYNTYLHPESADVFLFVKSESNRCVYKGKVRINKEPYQAQRHDDPTRKVWIFPLQLENVNSLQNEKAFQDAEAAAAEMQLEELYNRVKGKAYKRQPAGVLKRYDVLSTYYERSPDIAAYSKKRAKGRCDLCLMEAPFKRKDGSPYLEEHHIEWLSKGGPDEIDNVVALCPNCHRKMHIVEDERDVEALKERIKQYYQMGR